MKIDEMQCFFTLCKFDGYLLVECSFDFLLLIMVALLFT